MIYMNHQLLIYDQKLINMGQREAEQVIREFVVNIIQSGAVYRGELK